MNWFYKYGANDWVLLPVAQDAYDEPELTINQSTTFMLPVPWDHYSILNDGLVPASETAWDKDNTTVPGMLVVAAANSVAVADLNADFDAVAKLVLAHVIAWETDENYVYLECETWDGVFEREKITIDDNIRPETSGKSLRIKSFVTEKTKIECENTDASAVSWAADLHNKRTCRVVQKTLVEKTGTCTSNDQITPSKALDASTEDYTKLHDADICTLTAIMGHMQNEAAVGDADFNIRLDIPLERLPEGDLVLNSWHVHGSEGDASAYEAGHPFKIEIYNRTSAAWETLLLLSNQSATIGAGSVDFAKITITIREINDYYDYTNNWIQIRYVAGVNHDGVDYHGYFRIHELYITYMQTKHDPVEWLISDTLNDDELLLSTLADVFDTKTQKLNVGDLVYILYNDEEFLESTLDDYLMTDRIASIDCAACDFATFSDFNYMQILQHVNDVRLRNKLFSYLGRATASSKAILYFKAKASPVSSGITITPVNIAKDYNTRVRFNPLDKCRVVIAKNELTQQIWNGADSTLPAISLYPPAVIDCKKTPSGFLLDIAKAFYNMRSAFLANITTKIASISEVEMVDSYIVEDCAEYADGNDIYALSPNVQGTVYNNKSGTIAFLASNTIGGMRGRVGAVNGSSHFHVVFPTSTSTIAGAWIQFTMRRPNKTAPLAILFDGAGAAGYDGINMYSDGNFYLYKKPGDVTNCFAWSYDTDYTVRVTFVNATHYYLTINGVTNYEYNGGAGVEIDGTYTSITGFRIEANTNAGVVGYIDDITTSWVQSLAPGGSVDTPVQESDDATFFVGSQLHAHLCPTDVNLANYKIDGDYVIRSLKWTRDECAIVKLGFAEQDSKSLEQIIIDSIMKTRHESTS